jgi:hypothetical protein
MTEKELKEEYGPDYPERLIHNDLLMSLESETRFTRIYSADDQTEGYIVSRFMDGSATITIEELKREWEHWTKDEQIDFGQSCSWLHEQDDFADMIRYIAERAAAEVVGSIAGSLGAHLPRDEAFDLLGRALAQNRDRRRNRRQHRAGHRVDETPERTETIAPTP